MRLSDVYRASSLLLDLGGLASYSNDQVSTAGEQCLASIASGQRIPAIVGY